MYNYDIGEDMDSIRQIMGVCPQFDILWEELTAAEHLKMFAKLKGIYLTITIFINISKVSQMMLSQRRLKSDFVM